MTTARVIDKINLAKADQFADNALRRGVTAATLEAEEGMVKVLSEPGRGAPRSNGSRASAPGDSPAADTGFLRNSVRHEVTKTPTGWVGKVLVTAAYALPLQLGTERMAARPFANRVLVEFRSQIVGAFKRFAR
ncbi:MAG: hypothetical protein AAGL19_03415 [Pseudomonadota bacterium]